MAAGPNDLAPIGDALSWLGLLSDDSGGTIQRLITAVSANIQKYLGYNIAVTTYNETYNGIGSQRLMLRNRPIISVTTLNLVVGFAGFLNIPPRIVGGNIAGSAGFSNDDRAIYLDYPYRFERGFQNIQVTYQAGFTTVPPGLEQACLLWLQNLYTASAVGGGIGSNISEARAGDHALKFDLTLTKLATGVIPIPPNILNLIQPYIRVYPA